MNVKAVVDLAKDTFKDWNEDKASRLGAALAYYTIFSVGPLLLISIAIAGYVLNNQQGVQDQIVGTIGGLVGSKGSDAIRTMIQNTNKGGGTIIASAIGIISLLFGAAGVFQQLKDALNTIWEVAPKPNAGIMNTIRQKFLSFTMVLGTGFLLLVSLVINAGLAALNTFLKSLLPGADILWFVVNIVVTLGVITLMFALLFKFLPDVKVGWKDVWLGAAVTAILFSLGQLALGIYLGSGSVGSAFGAAGSIIIVLTWIYYSAQIFFFGAEFTQVYARKYGSKLAPAPNAEFVTEDARAQEGMTSQNTDGSRQPSRDQAKDSGPGTDTGKSTSRGTRKKGFTRRNVSPWFKDIAA